MIILQYLQKLKINEHYIYYLIELNTVINQTQIEEIINSNPNEILINHNEIELLKSNLENSQKYIIYGNKMNMKNFIQIHKIYFKNVILKILTE